MSHKPIIIAIFVSLINNRMFNMVFKILILSKLEDICHNTVLKLLQIKQYMLTGLHFKTLLLLKHGKYTI